MKSYDIRSSSSEVNVLFRGFGELGGGSGGFTVSMSTDAATRRNARIDTGLTRTAWVTRIARIALREPETVEKLLNGETRSVEETSEPGATRIATDFATRVATDFAARIAAGFAARIADDVTGIATVAARAAVQSGKTFEHFPEREPRSRTTGIVARTTDIVARIANGVTRTALDGIARIATLGGEKGPQAASENEF